MTFHADFKQITKYNNYFIKLCFRCDVIRVRVIRERLSATPGHVIGQGPAPGGQIVHCGGGGGDCGSGGLGRRDGSFRPAWHVL